MKVLFGILIAVGIVVVIGILVLGYFGFMPGVSNLFGSNKPKDLGVTFTQADYQSARIKSGTIITDLPSDAPPEQSLKFSGQKAENITYTQAEFNALLNNHPWKYYPLKDCQFKVNPDGTAEFSAVLLKDKLQSVSKALGQSDADLKVVMDTLKAVPGDPAIYMKGTVAVVNGKIVNTGVTDVQVGRLSLTGQVQDNLSGVVGYAQTQMNSIPGFTVKNFRLVNGQVQFEGTYPNVARSK